MTALYTIGHSNHPFAAFVELLRAHSITRVVDVRSAPYSQFAPHFNRDMLPTALTNAQITYHFAGDFLGGRPQDPTAYVAGAKALDEAERHAYLELVEYTEVMTRDYYQRGLRRLTDLIAAQPVGEGVAVMCSEGDPHTCHRHHLIARSLLDATVRVRDDVTEVRHILRDGALLTVTAATFAETPRQGRLF